MTAGTRTFRRSSPEGQLNKRTFLAAGKKSQIKLSDWKNNGFVLDLSDNNDKGKPSQS